MEKAGAKFPNLVEDLVRIKRFLEDFRDESGILIYLRQLQQLADRQTKVFRLNLRDVAERFDDGLASRIRKQCLSYSERVCRVVDELMPSPSADAVFERDSLDFLNEERVQSDQEGPSRAVPAGLTRRYHLVITEDGQKPIALRQLRSDSIGTLMTIRGIITAATVVKPKITFAAYICEQCGYEIYQEVKSNVFTPEVTCSSERCKMNQNYGRLFFQPRGSKFVNYQELRLQELPEDVPVGSIPRSIKVVAQHSATNQAVPGNIVTVTGMFLPEPRHGFKAITASTVVNAYFLGTTVVQQKRSYEVYSSSEELKAKADAVFSEGNVYDRLSRSLAPDIFGHEDVKKVLLLMLVGGSPTALSDVSIRGDVNVCLMGDPGVAKSQMLKWVSLLAPRAIYTTGKGSSGVGLTAAVVTDPHTGEALLEAGALVLSDRGICCIDEFDKMEEADRTSIHEVMEQQSVSIAKAGICTTLNARSSILAASNPLYGSWNRRKTVAENVNLPTSLLSRFDILWLILDEPDFDSDRTFSTFVARNHFNQPNGSGRRREASQIDMDTIRACIACAKTYNPVVPRSLDNHLVKMYIDMRQAKDEQLADATTWITPRTLLSILRLSQALARLRRAQEVAEEDVDEAVRLMGESKRSVLNANDTEPDNSARWEQAPFQIYEIIRELAVKGDGRTVRLDRVYPLLRMKGFPDDQLKEALERYSMANVWRLSSDRSSLTFCRDADV